MVVPDEVVLLVNGEQCLIENLANFRVPSYFTFSGLVSANVLRSQGAGPFQMAQSVIWTKAQAGDQSFC